jgi:hypothetical protein
MEENIFELTIEDWLRNRNANIELIKNNLMQIEMAKKVLLLCDEQIILCQTKTTLQEEEKNTKSATN